MGRIAALRRRRGNSENSLIHAAQDALKLRFAVEHGAGTLEPAIHRQRRRVEAPAFEQLKLGCVGLDLLLDQMQYAKLVGVECPAAQPGLERGAERLC